MTKFVEIICKIIFGDRFSIELNLDVLFLRKPRTGVIAKKLIVVKRFLPILTEKLFCVLNGREIFMQRGNGLRI